MDEFSRIKRLPPYIFGIIGDLKQQARRTGEDIIDMGMGNPDIPTPQPVVDKLVEAVGNPKNHRYSVSRGIYKLRLAITDWYRRRYNVDLDPESEAIVTMGAKEGLGHMVLSMISPGDVALVPNPAYPIHPYSVLIAGGDMASVPIGEGRDFFEEILKATKRTWPKPKLLIISFPNNPTTTVVELDFFQKVVDFAKDNNIYVIHDLAYADLVFDGYKAPSILQVPGAKDIGVEFFSMSKSYSMPGWRVGFAVGNPKLIAALAKLKSYFDYGMFQPIQIASIIALNEIDKEVGQITEIYRSRRDVLISGLNNAGWKIESPKATMFVWAKIPDQFKAMGSLEFTKKLLKEARVAVSPGIGFGEYGDEFVRFSLVENEHRTRQAVRGIRGIL